MDETGSTKGEKVLMTDEKKLMIGATGIEEIETETTEGDQILPTRILTVHTDQRMQTLAKTTEIL
jgi:hypothetical protein